MSQGLQEKIPIYHKISLIILHVCMEFFNFRKVQDQFWEI